MKVLSFIIPAYNSEAFLHKCVDSMLVPELLDKVEVIIVSDGSTDGTAAIGEEYAARYPQTVRLIVQENKGHGGALNTGLAAATGKYLKVIDADDWVLKENLPAFVEALEQSDSDVVLTHYHTVDISSGEVKEWRSFPETFAVPCTMEQVVNSWRSFDEVMAFHGIAYRREFYREFGGNLKEKCFYEDHEYATFPCCRAKSLLPLDLFVYEYRIGDVNQSVASTNQLKRITQIQTVLEQMAKKYQPLLPSPGKQYAAIKIQGLLLSYLTTALLVNPNKKEGRRMAAEIMTWASQTVPESYALAHRKYQAFLLMNHLHLSKTTWTHFIQSRLYKWVRKSRR